MFVKNFISFTAKQEAEIPFGNSLKKAEEKNGM